MYPHYYQEPLEPWLNDFTIKVGGQDYKPYDPTAAQKIADEARKSLGDLVPTDPEIIKKYIGAGWWKRDLACCRTAHAGRRHAEERRQVGHAGWLGVQSAVDEHE